jgi:hypothetical protein
MHVLELHGYRDETEAYVTILPRHSYAPVGRRPYSHEPAEKADRGIEYEQSSLLERLRGYVHMSLSCVGLRRVHS